MAKYGIHQTPKEVMAMLSQNIRAIRKEKKLTQKELSKRSGVAYATLVKFENNGIISLESLLKLCLTLGRLEEFQSILKPGDLSRKEALFDI